jgi:hypothetical protein
MLASAEQICEIIDDRNEIDGENSMMMPNAICLRSVFIAGDDAGHYNVGEEEEDIS